MYPRIIFDSKKYRENALMLRELLDKNNMTFTAVTKVYSADLKIVETIVDIVDYFADSRIENIIKMKDVQKPKILLRLPMLSEVKKVVEYVDISFNSEIETIKALNEEANNQNKVHKILIMKDMGDLREGYFGKEELFEAVEEILKLKNIEIFGLGVNLTCYGGILPSEKNMDDFADLASEIEEKYDLKFKMISGGNSSALELLKSGKVNKKINNLRVGDALVSGEETAHGKVFDDLNSDVFKLETLIIELKEKPSYPIGEIGRDAFGAVPSFVDKGLMKRAIVAIGRQDIHLDSISTIDKALVILGGSSDHLLIDLTKASHDYKVGSIVEMSLSYSSILSAYTSEFVKKAYI